MQVRHCITEILDLCFLLSENIEELNNGNISKTLEHLQKVSTQAVYADNKHGVCMHETSSFYCSFHRLYFIL